MPWLTPDAHMEAVEQARDIVLRRLDRSSAPRAQLEELLARKEVDSRVAQEVLDRLEAAGLVDDTAYAAMVARTRFTEKGAARRAIAEELRRKGLGEKAIAAALEQIGDDDERAAARQLAAKKMRSLQGLDEQVRKRRLAAFLGRKGYSASIVWEVVNSAVQEAETE